MNLNEAHTAWIETPSYETEREFGLQLLEFCTSVVTESHKTRKQYVDDIVGDCVLKIWSSLPSYNKNKSSFTTWAHTVVTNMWKNASRNRFNKQEMALYELNGYGAESPNIVERLDLKIAISKLSEEDQAIVKYNLEGCTQTEIGEKIGKPTKYVENSWLRRILPKLKELAAVESPGTQPA
jgi:RNA polymerase sigma factor (sigma-70 family)